MDLCTVVYETISLDNGLIDTDVSSDVMPADAMSLDNVASFKWDNFGHTSPV